MLKGCIQDQGELRAGVQYLQAQPVYGRTEEGMNPKLMCVSADPGNIVRPLSSPTTSCAWLQVLSFGRSNDIHDIFENSVHTSL